MKTTRPWTPYQPFLLPPSPTEWLPEGHLAYFILDIVAELDLRRIKSALDAKDPRGERPFAPPMMVALLVYGYSTGVFSSRALARATYEDVAFRVIAGGTHPHFTTVNEFRRVHRQALAALFHQVLGLCQSAGLVKLGHVAIDGSKIKASASKHKAMSHERMVQRDEQLTLEIEGLLARADAADAADDAQYGVGQEPEDLPAELQRREGRQAKIRAALAALKAEAAQTRATTLREQAEALQSTAATESVPARQRRAASTLASKRTQQAMTLDPDTDESDEGNDDDDEPPPASTADLPSHRVPTQPDGTPTPKAQRNFTDPDSRIMVRDGAFLQAYNVQIAVDEAHQVIVAEALTNQSPDCEHFEPLLRRAIVNCGDVPACTTADAGYFSEENVRAAERLGTEPLIPPERQRRHRAADAPPLRSTPARDRMRAELLHPRGKKLYSRRKCTVEPVFGQMFAARGFRQFLLRGLPKVRFEWTFLCLTHNLLKLFRVTSSRPALLAAA